MRIVFRKGFAPDFQTGEIAMRRMEMARGLRHEAWERRMMRLRGGLRLRGVNA